MTLDDCISDYLKYLRFEQGATVTTYKAYGASLREFVRRLQSNGYSAPTLADFNIPNLFR